MTNVQNENIPDGVAVDNISSPAAVLLSVVDTAMSVLEADAASAADLPACC